MAVRKGKKVKKSAKKAVSSVSYNRNAQWKAYRELQMQANKAWEKLRDDVKKKAQSDTIIRDNNHLLLLLGECNYMARECMRMAGKGKKKAR